MVASISWIAVAIPIAMIMVIAILWGRGHV